jgi:hypothetical protein
MAPAIGTRALLSSAGGGPSTDNDTTCSPLTNTKPNVLFSSFSVYVERETKSGQVSWQSTAWLFDYQIQIKKPMCSSD